MRSFVRIKYTAGIGRELNLRTAGVRQVSEDPSDLFWQIALAHILVLAFCCLGATASEAQTFGCNPPMANPIVCENSKVGNPVSEWDVNGVGDTTIQGFATDISVNQGEIVRFKISTNASAYRLDIYRMGYYGGLGARKVATVLPSAPLPQNQPACVTDAATGLVDCGNWAESASWAVPLNATSGIYFARLVRTDTAGASHIFFVVRADGGSSALLFQTSDTTWQAYNAYGGNSLYSGSPAGRAYKVSYNRPFTTRQVFPNGHLYTWVFSAEYPMVRWLEANGYDVAYFTGVDSDRRGSKIIGHKVFLSVGHDEYWSAAQRANVEAARGAGVHLAFFSGNEVFWKTRWENNYRTLVCYKETHAGQPIDPLDPPTWTGSWRDPRFSPPADGGRPENALTGTLFMVNGTRTDAITVPAGFANLRFWRNTSIATLPPGQTATFPTGTLGYEWDVVPDNGFRPAGLFLMSSTTLDVSPQYLLDYGSTYGSGTATHNLSLYRSGSALVFGAGTVQWSWGLDGNHDNGGSTPDPNMQQATVNLFADMGVQPATLQPGLVFVTASTDTIAPTSRITSPSAGSNLPIGNPVTITGTASDTGGVVAGVEISVDGGTTWHPATGTTSWRYAWTPSALGSVTLKSRAVDDSANLEAPSAGVTINVVPDTVPPAISGVQANPVSNTWAVISWTTNKLSDSQVDYGTTTAYGASSVLDSTMVTNHSITVNGLASAMVYHYRVKSRDAAGNLGFSTDFTFTTAATNSTQTITFDALPANQPLNGVYPSGLIDWGTGVWMVSGPWGAFTGNSISFVDGTMTSASFSFVARMLLLSMDAYNGGSASTTITVSCPGQPSKQVVLVAGQLSTIPTGWFDACTPVTITSTNGWYTNFANLVVDSPPATPPVISAVQGGAISCSTASISWTTDKQADSQVDYGTTSAYGTSTPLDSTMVTSHLVPLRGLLPSTLYHFRADSRDNWRTLASSSDYTFTTAPAGPLGVISGLQSTAITNSSAYITWTTSTATDSQVDYGTTAAYGTTTALNPTLVTSHSVFLPGLSATTVYHYRVRSRDVCGNQVISGDLTFTTTNTPPYSIWTTTATPAITSASDASAVEVGVRFTSDVGGSIIGIRFYKGPANTGTHTGNLWSNTGTLLATTTFVSETASGWQQVNFSAPIAIAANTTYVASYHTNVGGYSRDAGYFSVSGFDNRPLHALKDAASSPNGVYIYGPSAFPNQTYLSTNYWVDVLFTAPPSTPPTLSGVQAIAITNSSAYITWTTDQASDSQVDYGVTTAYGTSTPLNSALVTSHSVQLNGLAANTVYHFRVKSRNASMDQAVSGDLTFTTTNTPPRTIWSNTAVPAIASTGDTSAVELGVKFRSDLDGYIVGLRFYKGTANTGTHIGNLWTSTGTLLGSVTFVNETASGWQQVNFSTPIPITANTTYVASYHTNVGGYAADRAFFSAIGVDAPPLHALSNASAAGNGVYLYGSVSAFPSQTYASTNYWMDVVFAPQ